MALGVEILAHRGWWTAQDEKNTRTAFLRALEAGFGLETDVRDCDGEIVISHDTPLSDAMSFEVFLSLYVSVGASATLALNIKADGLVEKVEAALAQRDIDTYFVFDMSVPDTLHYLRRAMPVFTRRSEYETGSLLDARAQGIWLDCFERAYAPAADLHAILQTTRSVALVSPELHGKPHEEAWEAWRTALTSVRDDARVMLCSDFPDKAHAFFNPQDFGQ